MIKALLIAPYPGLGEMAKKLPQPDDIQLDIKIANLDEGVKAAKLAEKQGYEIIISRGGTATMIQDEVSIPVVHIDITGYDMLRVFTLIRGMKTGVALVGYANISEGAATICNILEFDVKMITITSRTEVRSQLEQLKQTGYTVVIGDVITVQVAEQVGLRGILITSGKEALTDAFEEGRRIYNLFRKVKKQFSYLHETFLSLPFPVVLLNQNNHIVEGNYKYEQDIKPGELMNSPIIPSLIQKVLRDKNSHWEELEDENNLFEIQAFLVSETENIVGLIFHSTLNKSNRKAVRIIHNPVHIPIIGESAYAQRLRENLHQYANGDESICIIGEPGTGKETLAKAIHFERYGQLAPLVIVKGKYLTALDELKRKLSTVPNATIVLKDLEELSGNIQQEMLNVLTHVSKKLKIITLADISLHELISRGAFDKELYQKVAQYTLHLAPLRERKQDIRDFVNYFLTEFHAEQGNDTLGMKPEAIEYMMQYNWLENLDFLKQVVRELSITTKGNYVDVDQVKRLLIMYEQDTKKLSEEQAISLNGTLKEMEQQIIKHVLEEEGNNQSKAASRLGINRSTLWRKLKS